MKKIIIEILAWIVFAAIIGGCTWLGLIMWAWEIEYCFGM